MALNEITQTLGQYKETIGLIIAGVSGSITHIANKMRKGEKMTFSQNIAHLIISGFVGLMTYKLLNALGFDSSLNGFIIGLTTYSSIQIIDAIDMVKAKTIYNLFIDFIKYKIGK